MTVSPAKAESITAWIVGASAGTYQVVGRAEQGIKIVMATTRSTKDTFMRASAVRAV